MFSIMWNDKRQQDLNTTYKPITFTMIRDFEMPL